MRPNAHNYRIIEQPQCYKPILAIIFALILIGNFEPIENSASFRQIQSPHSQRPFVFRIVEFDFHIIIVYTINRKSQVSEALHRASIIG